MRNRPAAASRNVKRALWRLASTSNTPVASRSNISATGPPAPQPTRAASWPDAWGAKVESGPLLLLRRGLDRLPVEFLCQRHGIIFADAIVRHRQQCARPESDQERAGFLRNIVGLGDRKIVER